jgi:hypothetical protein
MVSWTKQSILYKSNVSIFDSGISLIWSNTSKHHLEQESSSYILSLYMENFTNKLPIKDNLMRWIILKDECVNCVDACSINYSRPVRSPILEWHVDQKSIRPGRITWGSTLVSMHTTLSKHTMCLLRRTCGLQRPPDEAPHFTEAVSTSFLNIRVTPHHPQGTIHFPILFTHSTSFLILTWALEC